MYWTATYYRVKQTACIWLIIMAGVIRVSTNYLYGMHYQDADPSMWETLYFKGQSCFELFILMAVAGLAKQFVSDRYFLAISYFTDLAVYAWVKEYFLNPMQWQVFEEAGFLFSLSLLVLRITVSKRRREAIIKYFKLILR
jgi:hypothetical protein